MIWTLRDLPIVFEKLMTIGSEKSLLQAVADEQLAAGIGLGDLRSLLFRSAFDAIQARKPETAKAIYEVAWSLSDDRDLGANAYARRTYALSFSPRAQTELASICRATPPVFVTGCARSGTTLALRCIGGTISDSDVLWPEAWIFTLIDNPPTRTTVLKRGGSDRSFFAFVPPDVRVVHIVRHPADVCTSYLPGTTQYYLDSYRWLDEFAAAKRLFTAHPPENLTVVRYEDLLLEPDGVQNRIAAQFGVSFDHPFSRYHERNDRDTSVDRSGARRVWPPINAEAAYRHRTDSTHADRIGTFTAELGKSYGEFCEMFGYETHGA